MSWRFAGAPPEDCHLLGRLLRVRAAALGDPVVDSVLQSARPARKLYAHARTEEMPRPTAQHIARRVAGWTWQAVSERSAFQALHSCQEAEWLLSWERLACNAVPALRRMGEGRHVCLFGRGDGEDAVPH